MPTALLIVDHGSKREAANKMLEEVAVILRRQRPDLIVQIAHMELAEPTIAQGFEACVREGATEVIVHPYMLSPGRHAAQDIPVMASEAAKTHPGVKWRCTKPLGLHDKLGEVILERAGLSLSPEPQSKPV
ncbi:MAG: sirohydrochlorin cobaltochelatase [Planctomycetes bacterium]|nr:sirohydrochlorin cobaltochelatase [Planctomycetota bacterium]